MPMIGEELVTAKEYRDLRARWRQAQTSTPFKRWAQHELSPAGERDRELVERERQREQANQKRIAAGIRAQRAAMDAETRPEPAEVRRLREQANQRDGTWNYTDAAVAAQRELQRRGLLQPTPSPWS
jgi:hypothetical protein